MTQTIDPWVAAKAVIGSTRVLAGPQLSQQLLHAPDHLAFVLARYRAAAALIGEAESVLEIGCGEGIGAGILARGRHRYAGMDPDEDALDGISDRTVRVVETMIRPCEIEFAAVSTIFPEWVGAFDAVVSLDVVEHVPAEQEAAFMENAVAALTDRGVMVLGTPSKYAEQWASPQSRAGHINLHTPERLKALMARYFHVVQMLYSQDTSLHLGRPEMAHYIFSVGHGPR